MENWKNVTTACVTIVAWVVFFCVAIQGCVSDRENRRDYCGRINDPLIFAQSECVRASH